MANVKRKYFTTNGICAHSIILELICMFSVHLYYWFLIFFNSLTTSMLQFIEWLMFGNLRDGNKKMLLFWKILYSFSLFVLQTYTHTHIIHVDGYCILILSKQIALDTTVHTGSTLSLHIAASFPFSFWFTFQCVNGFHQPGMPLLL